MSNMQQCYIIAEAGLNHNGSLQIAKQLIDVASVAGANAIKFQKRTVAKLAVGATLDAPDDRFPEFGSTYREIRNYLEFGFDQYCELKNYAEKKGLDFMVTAFDTDAVDFLLSIGVKYFKLASHSLTNLNLLNYLAQKKMHTILSTGMSNLEEVDTAVGIFREHGAALKLMHCVSAYPTPLHECNLAMLELLKSRYNLPVGYSGHEIGYLPSVMAVTLGAKMIERHFTLDKNMVGFDHKMSLDPGELIAMIRDIRSVPKIIGTGKKEVSDTELITRRKYHVSAVSLVNISKGAELTEAMLTYRNPGTGIPAKLIYRLIGKRAVFDIPVDTLLSEAMFN